MSSPEVKVDVEKAANQGLAPPDARPGTSAESQEADDSLGFEPIRTGGPVRPDSKAGGPQRSPSASRTISRTRSQNGYSCDEYPDDGSGEDTPEGADTSGSQTPENKDPYEVAFDGGDADLMCPRSMGTARKWLIVSIVSGASFCVTAASSIYTSTYTQMDAEFNTSRIVSTLGLSTFVLGISLGPMFLGPLSEFYGRRPIYLVSWTLYLIWIIPQAVARNIATMIVARFFDGLAGSAFLAVSGGTVSDLFTRKDLQAPMLLYSLAPFTGPAIGPAVGGFINYFADWRWTYYVLLIWTFVMLLLIVFFVPETYHPVILRNKARRKRRETGDDRWKAPMEKTSKSIIRTIGVSLERPFQLLIFEPMVLNLCLFSAILLGILYLFFGAFPLVFRNIHGFNLWQIGLSFMGILVGMLCAAASDPLWHHIRDRLVARLERDSGTVGRSEPEFRLPPAICGAFLVTIGLFIFGWTSYPHVHWIAPIIGSAVFGAGTLLVFTGIFTFLVDAYPLYAASALAANAFVRCLFAAAFPLFGNQMYDKLGYPWASSLLGFLTLIMLPFPYLFFRYGKRIRGHSRFATD